MSRKRPTNGALPSTNVDNIRFYCELRKLDLLVFNYGGHLRINDGDITIVDTWPSTGKYWVKETNYNGGAVERGGESGYLPSNKAALTEFLDQIFYATEL